MRKVKYHVAATLDGFIAEEDGSFGCFPTEGDHIADYLESLKTYDAVLMGRKTYEVGVKMGVTNPYPHMKSYVFSRTLTESPDEQVELVSGNAIEMVRSLKSSEGGDIYLCGGADLATQLFAEHLVDEVIVKLNPLLLGKGIPLMQSLGQPIHLELIDSHIYESGVVLLTYRVHR